MGFDSFARPGAAALALLISAGAAQAQTTTPTPVPSPPPPMAPQQPVPLFKAVCIDGTARLSRRWAMSAAFEQIPAEGRALLNANSAGNQTPLTAADAPNPIFQISAGDTYLMIPTPTAIASASYANSCAVVWRGTNFAEARALVPTGGTSTATFASATSGDRVVTATSGNGWIALRVEPMPTTSAPRN